MSSEPQKNNSQGDLQWLSSVCEPDGVRYLVLHMVDSTVSATGPGR